MDSAIASEIAPRKPATVETTRPRIVGASQALLRAAIKGADRVDDEVVADKAARHHGDVNDRDENETAHEVGVRELSHEAGECHPHHDEETGVEDVGEDRPERDAEDTRAQGHVRGGEAGDEDTACDNGQDARTSNLLGEEEGDERGR